MEVALGSQVVLVYLFGVGAFIVWAWRVVDWVWWRPRKIERCLRDQGLSGNPYRLLYGDTKELTRMSKEAEFKPMGLFNHDVVPRVFPFHHHIIRTYGKKSFSWMGPIARVNIMEPELIKEILMNNNVFKKPTPNPIAKFLVSGISGYEDEKWAKHRKIINPAFYIEKLKNMLPAMYLSCSGMVSKWEMLVSEKGSTELDVQPHLEILTSDVISRTAFGSSYEEGRKIFQLLKEQVELIIPVFQSVYVPGLRFLPTKRNNRLKEINKELKSLLRGIINRRESAMKVGEAAGEDDLLSLLMSSNQREIREHGNNKKVGMTRDEVIEECKTFYFAGQETTSNLLAWTMVLLSMHPNWQARAREEVSQFFGNDKPDFDGLNHLKIITMILYEVLRLYPPATLFTRIIYKETKLGEMTIPPGVEFVLPIILVHHDTETWGEDAKEFKPERFSEGIAKATKNRLSFFPFSWGPRICIGNNFALIEVKMVLATILQHFSFELSPSYTHAPSLVPILQPQKGVHVILHKLS